MMYGLAVNVSKTNMFSSGIAEVEIQRIASRFGLARSSLPVRYLGTPLCTKNYLGQDGPTLLGIPLFALVSDVWNGSSWSFSAARSNRQLQLLSFLTTISPANGQDVPKWTVSGNTHKSFISRLVWEAIRPHLPVKAWAPLLWHKGLIPRHATTTWLFILDRNPTLDRLLSWGLDVDTICLLCGNADESRNHLFFECQYSVEVWLSICARLNFTSPPTSWNATMTWLPNASSDRSIKIALLQAWQATVYSLWQERNIRFHSGQTIPSSVLGRNIHRMVSDKCMAMVALGQTLGTPLLRIWKPQ
ncbi:hypothetical protein HID58_049156 [Brassica napus]|uniref:Reverse transcriptase zinc-binding domain-containing protein n=1 Tax=Brassica napus TaxID=3708 RepID=A0ABQ8B555_BRANA|nr:hypothetical protein HID58_049156 [Brassica napus]